MATLDVLSAAEAAAVVNAPAASGTKLAAVTTAVSLRLDELVGPVIRRVITTERHPGPSGRQVIFLRRFPVYVVSAALDYDEGGSSTTLTEETASSKPADGFLLAPTLAEPELELFGPTVERRTSGRRGVFAGEVSVTYTAGRFTNTAAVDERYKEAARIMVSNLWQRVTPGAGNATADFDLPRFPFPTFAVPKAAKELLLDVWQERAGTLGIA